MTRVTRRSFLAGSAAALAAPYTAIAQTTDADVIVVGAGAAGIAAARRVVAAGRRCVILEASDRIGGRCFTDTRTFGVPYDRGAHWLHTPDINPLVKVARGTGLDVYAAPRGQRLRIGRRFGREGEVEDFLANVVRSARAIGDVTRTPRDMPAAQALPKDLGDWRPTVEFMLGPYLNARDLDELSAQEFSRVAERGDAMYCREGLGTLIAKLADPSIVRLSTAVTAINMWGRGTVEMQTTKGWVRGRAAVVTSSTGVLSTGKLKFDPVLPRRHLDALAKLPMGTYEHIAVQFDGNPLGLESDDLVFEKANDAATAALLANVSGNSLCLIAIGGRHARKLAGGGEAAMVAFAGDWLVSLFGTQIKNEIRKAHATQWSKEPWILGAAAATLPGGAGMRRALMEPVRDRVWFAGEAVHETLYGTVGGAWESGERAAEAALKRLGGGGGSAPAPRRPARPRRRAPSASSSSPTYTGTPILRGRD